MVGGDGDVSNLHRIQWIDAMIRAGRYPNGRTIADKFEISHRQAARDIEYLRDSMGAPLVYSARENGYYYDDDTFVLPAQVISDEERHALAYLAQRYAGAGGVAGHEAGRLFHPPGRRGWGCAWRHGGAAPRSTRSGGGIRAEQPGHECLRSVVHGYRAAAQSGDGLCQ